MLLGVSLARISPTSRPHLARTTAGIVVFATHYGEDILDGGDHGMTLIEQTALTSRNITGGHAMNVRCSRATSNPNLTLTLTTGPGPDPDLDPSPHPEPQPEPWPGAHRLHLATDGAPSLPHDAHL